MEHILSLEKDYDDVADLEADIEAFKASRAADTNKQREDTEVCVHVCVCLYYLVVLI